MAGNTRYTKDEIKEMVADDKWMKNTVLLTTFHSKVDMSDIPFMNSVEFTFVSYDTICIQVNEKKVVGYVEYEGQKVILTERHRAGVRGRGAGNTCGG